MVLQCFARTGWVYLPPVIHCSLFQFLLFKIDLFECANILHHFPRLKIIIHWRNWFNHECSLKFSEVEELFSRCIEVEYELAAELGIKSSMECGRVQRTQSYLKLSKSQTFLWRILQGTTKRWTMDLNNEQMMSGLIAQQQLSITNKIRIFYIP